MRRYWFWVRQALVNVVAQTSTEAREKVCKGMGSVRPRLAYIEDLDDGGR